MKTEQEKAKAYDVALEKAKDYHKQLLDEDNPEWASEIEKIFPELKESDDERARKEILDYIIKGSEDCYDVEQYGREKFEKWIAWLEKQKPVWSEEEDETVLNNLIYALANDRIGNNRDGYVDWLKSLKDRVQPQNKWISVDKEVYVKEPVLAQKKDKSDPFKGYVVCCDHTLVPNVYERYIELDNNCYQTTWKPSIAQLNALGIVSKGNAPDDIEAIVSLYNDLKKLKGDMQP